MHAWPRKAVADGLKALLPFQPALRRLKRSLLPYHANPNNDLLLLQEGLDQIRLLRGRDITLHGSQVVEIGTGWKPVLPILYRQAGAARVITVDQERLTDAQTFSSAVSLIRRERRSLNGMAADGILDWLIANAQPHRRLESLLEYAAIDYLAPYDFRRLPTGCADLIVSRDVFEHVPETLLTDIVRQSRRILRSGGVICHTIDMSDHWEHADKSISRVNFLRYDGPLWRLAGLNAQNYQNRLRRYEFVDIFRAAGFQIIEMTGSPDPAALEALKTLPLCPRYADAPHDELAILSTTIIARKRAVS